jgi:hypothetical protein
MGPDDMGAMPGAPPQMPMNGPMGAMALPPGMMPAQMAQPEQEVGPMLAELDMDIIIDRAPEAATLQAEQFETLSQLAQAGILGQPGNPDVARMLITSSSLPEKTQLLDLLDKMATQQKPNPQQLAQLKELEAKVASIVANTQKTQAETAKIGAQIPGEHANSMQAGAQAQDAQIAATINRLGGIGASSPPAMAAAQGRPPSISMNYKDAPPDVRREIEAAAGLQPSAMPEAMQPPAPFPTPNSFTQQMSQPL